MRIGEFQQRSRSGSSLRKLPRRLLLERLEDRTVPTGILYQYPSGYAIRYFGGPIIPNVDVDLIFWGSGWQNGIGAAEQPNVQDAAGSIAGGPYMSRLAQYGVGNGVLQRSDFVTSTDPLNPYPDPPDDFGIVHVVAMLRNRIALGLLPDPRTDPQRFYYVVTQPGTHLLTGVGEAGGYHDYDISPLDGATHYRFGLGSNPISTRLGDATNIDWVTSIFSHELVEAATDPEGRTAPGWSRAPFGGAHELCDDEAQLYNYRLGNYLVQSYWSGLDAGSPVVPTGTVQNFLVDNATSRVLTVAGDQVVQNDVARLEVTADGRNKITLNGEVALFDRYLPWWFDQNGLPLPTLNGIIVNTLTGTNAVVVASSNVPIHVNMLNGVNDSLHVGDPGVGLLDAIQAPLWAVGQANAVDVFFHDQAYGGNDTYTFDFNGGLGLYTLTRTGGNQPFFWYDRVRTLTLFTGFGNDTVNVLVTAPITVTTVNVGAGVDTVNVGKNNTLSTIAGGLNVNGQAGGVLTLNLNDQAYAPNTRYTLTNNTLTRPGIVGIGYTLVSNFNLNAGTGANTITIRSVAAGTLYTVVGGPAYDTIEIPQGPVSTNQLQWVDIEALLIDGGNLSIDNNVTIQDLTVTAGTLTGTRTLTITNLARWQGGTTSGTGLFLVINQATWTGGVMNGAGVTEVGFGATMAISGGVTLDVRTLDNEGTLNWNGPNIGGLGVVQNNGGLLGTGTFTGTLNNAGNLYPGGVATIGTITVGTYSQTGTIDIDINGVGFDTLVVTGMANLGGTMNIDLRPGFVPAVGTVRMVVPYGGHAGAFNLVANNLDGNPDDNCVHFTGEYLANGFRIIEGIHTITTLASSANPSVYGQAVTFTATVNAIDGMCMPTGTVTFFDGANALATVALVGNQATFTADQFQFAVGNHNIKAVYNGDNTHKYFFGSMDMLVQTVNKADTFVQLVSSLNPSHLGDNVTFTATVSALFPGAGTPTGTVSFFDAGVLLATAPLNGVPGNDQATYSTNALAVGTHPITATYNGDANFNPSTSGILNQIVLGGTSGPAFGPTPSLATSSTGTRQITLPPALDLAAQVPAAPAQGSPEVREAVFLQHRVAGIGGRLFLREGLELEAKFMDSLGHA